jgi:hypothetical protein
MRGIEVGSVDTAKMEALATARGSTMKKVAICAGVAGLLIIASSVRLRRAGTGLSASDRKTAYARMAKAWSAPRKALAAGWGEADLPIAKLTDQAATGRLALPELAPRVSVLLLGTPRKPQAALVVLEVLAITSRLDKLTKAYAGEALSLPGERVVVIATHTHAGPRPHFGPALQLAFGRPELAEKGLAAATAYAAEQARLAYRRVWVSQASTRFSTYIANRSVGSDAAVDDRLRALIIDAGPRRLLVWSYAAHPTLVARHSDLADGDYPARVAARLRSGSGLDQVIFLPGMTAQATVATQRHPDHFAEAIGRALTGLIDIAEQSRNAKGAFSFDEIPLPKLDPRLPLLGPFVASAALSNWAGSSPRRLHLLRFGPVAMTLVAGEPSFGLVPVQAGSQWVVGMAGSGLGYLVQADDAHRLPEAPLVLLSGTELTAVGELLQIVSGVAPKPQ